MKQVILAVCAGAALGACAAAQTTPAPTEAPALGGAPGPVVFSGALRLGDWRGGETGAVAQEFAAAVESRYGQGVGLADAREDIARAGFRCASEAGAGAGAAALACRREETQRGCRHAWNVYLFTAQGQTLSRARGLYDRRCGDEDLLGGPG